MNQIFEPYNLNATISLKNRIVMAPLTRCFAQEGFVPANEAPSYYAKRADSGLIISEATVIAPSGHGYPNTPGIYTEDQIEGWKRVTDAVHAEGGKIFLQLWHVGRVSHSIYLDGEQPVAPSAVPIDGRVPRTNDLRYPTPRALETAEIKTLVENYIQGSKNAILAGFDGVEIHGANGYLIDQFLHTHTNQRDDQYGGSLKNRTRFALEVVDGVCKAIGSERVGIRLSPGAYVNMFNEDGDEQTFISLLKELEPYKLAYVHTGIFDDSMTFDYLNGGATEFLRKHYSGTIIACGGYSAQNGQHAIQSGKSDLVAIGRSFIANPDLVERLKSNQELVEYNESMLAELV
jgi:N-ethylmaleimide reductase